MIWLVLSILTAFFESLKDVFSKQSLKALDEYVVVLFSQAFSVLFLLPALWLTGIPSIGPDFWKALLIGGTLNVVSFTLYVKAIKLTDLSLVVPLVTLTPLFLLVTSPLIVHEWPTLADGVGVVLLVVGSYILNLQGNARSHGSMDYWAPFCAMLTNPGSRLMLLVALLWSVTSAFDKVGVQNSSPFFWCVSLFSFIASGILPIVLLRSRLSVQTFQKILPQTGNLSRIGLAFAIAVGCQMLAVSLVPVTQVIAVKRMSALMSVLWGHYLFGETGLRERLLGASIMVGGVVIMTLF